MNLQHKAALLFALHRNKRFGIAGGIREVKVKRRMLRGRTNGLEKIESWDNQFFTVRSEKKLKGDSRYSIPE
jgi:hypothetical protein